MFPDLHQPDLTLCFTAQRWSRDRGRSLQLAVWSVSSHHRLLTLAFNKEATNVMWRIPELWCWLQIVLWCRVCVSIAHFTQHESTKVLHERGQKKHYNNNSERWGKCWPMNWWVNVRWCLNTADEKYIFWYGKKLLSKYYVSVFLLHVICNLVFQVGNSNLTRWSLWLKRNTTQHLFSVFSGRQI